MPSDRTSDERRRQGAITKAGRKHSRRLLVEAAKHVWSRPGLSEELRPLVRAPGAPTGPWPVRGGQTHQRWALDKRGSMSAGCFRSVAVLGSARHGVFLVF
jgi:hypothetical protein